MKFVKPPLTFAQQADLLIRRGMVADRAVLEQRLASVNYYRSRSAIRVLDMT